MPTAESVSINRLANTSTKEKAVWRRNRGALPRLRGRRGRHARSVPRLSRRGDKGNIDPDCGISFCARSAIDREETVDTRGCRAGKIGWRSESSIDAILSVAYRKADGMIRGCLSRPRKRGSAPRSILVGQIQIIGLRLSNLLVWPIQGNGRWLTR